MSKLSVTLAMVAMQAKVKVIDKSHDSVREEDIWLLGAHLVIREANNLYTLKHRICNYFYQLAVGQISFFVREVRMVCFLWVMERAHALPTYGGKKEEMH